MIITPVPDSATSSWDTRLFLVRAARRTIPLFLLPLLRQIDLREIGSREERDRPVERDPEARIPPRHLKEVIRAANPPREEARDLDPSQITRGTRVSERRHHTERLVHERLS